jgi:hypothetical protein
MPKAAPVNRNAPLAGLAMGQFRKPTRREIMEMKKAQEESLRRHREQQHFQTYQSTFIMMASRLSTDFGDPASFGSDLPRVLDNIHKIAIKVANRIEAKRPVEAQPSYIAPFAR